MALEVCCFDMHVHQLRFELQNHNQTLQLMIRRMAARPGTPVQACRLRVREGRSVP